MLAIALLRLNESSRALEVMAPVLESGESRPEFWELAAEAHTRLGNLDKAAPWLSKLEQAKPESAAVQQKQAELNMRRGRPDLALADYAAAAKLSKSVTSADTMLVLLNLRARDFDRALAAIATMEEKAPGEPFAINLKGVVLLEQGKLKEAAETFEGVLKKTPSFLPAAANLARLDLREGKTEQAKKRFEAVLAADKNHVQALLTLASMERSVGRSKEALVLLERAASAQPAALEPRSQLVDLLVKEGRLKDARARAEEAVTRNPNNLAALELLANVKLREGDKHSAVATFVRIAELNPKSPAVHVARAQAERAAGLPREAEASLRRALELQKTYGPAQLTLFELLMQQNRVGPAIEFAKQLKDEYPKSPLGYVFEAEAAVFQKRYKEAVPMYRKALELGRAPDFAVRLYLVRTLAGEGKEALAELQQWVTDHPRQVEPRMQLGRTLLEKGDYAGALKEFQAVLGLTPSNPLAANNLAWAYYKTGNLAEAMRFAEGARKLAPDNPYVNDTLGWLMLKQGKDKEARELLAKVASTLKDSPEVRYHYAAALAKSGDKDGAVRELNSALALSKSFPERDDAVALLENLKR
jgi:putative PEP-CTERM system TPR-repeat lipoprotein